MANKASYANVLRFNFSKQIFGELWSSKLESSLKDRARETVDAMAETSKVSGGGVGKSLKESRFSISAAKLKIEACLLDPVLFFEFETAGLVEMYPGLKLTTAGEIFLPGIYSIAKKWKTEEIAEAEAKAKSAVEAKAKVA